MAIEQIAHSSSPAPEAGFLVLDGLAKSYGALKAVDNVSLSINRGEFVSLLGPSGCGKTTTLRIIAGFITPNAGQIVLDGERVDLLPSHKRGMAMVFQNYALFPHMTVFDNIAFGLKMRRVGTEEIRERVAEVLRLVQLPQYGTHYPRQISGGQQQRVALARALVVRPKVLLLDEPLSNLDAKLRKELRIEFLEIHRAAQITTIFVTHDLEDAFSMSDRVAVMRHGELEQAGTPLEIYTRPRNVFVADFVGHSNVFEGVVERVGDGVRLIAGGLPFDVSGLPGAGSRAVIALPAHKVGVSRRPAAADNSLEAKVKHVSFLGSSLHLVLEMGGLTVSSELPVSEELSDLRNNDKVYAHWSKFDPIVLP